MRTNGLSLLNRAHTAIRAGLYGHDKALEHVALFSSQSISPRVKANGQMTKHAVNGSKNEKYTSTSAKESQRTASDRRKRTQRPHVSGFEANVTAIEAKKTGKLIPNYAL